MRIWDVPAWYLNRQSLLAEHRELHGLYSILANGKKGYSRHPETLRWVGCMSGLTRRHGQLVDEMLFRGYQHHTPLRGVSGPVKWPAVFVTQPVDQYLLLATKYVGREQGRIHLPRSAKELWAGHRRVVPALDAMAYGAICRRLRTERNCAGFAELAEELVRVVRKQ